MDNIPGGEWLMRFAARVRERNPKAQSRSFVQAAWAVWRERASTSPEAAAEDFAAQFSAKAPGQKS